MTPLAYAEGTGLPRELIWVSVAAAVFQRPYVDEDVRWLLEQAKTFIVEAAADERTVYRLADPDLAASLCEASHERRLAVQGLFVDILLATVPTHGGRRQWSKADPYVRRHLIDHCTKARRLATLTSDPWFFACADRSRALAALTGGSDDGETAVADVYLRVAHKMRMSAPTDGAVALQLMARKVGAARVAEALDPVLTGAPCTVEWARWTAGGDAVNYVLGSHEDEALSVAVVRGDTSDLVYSGGKDYWVRSWNLDAGTAAAPDWCPTDLPGWGSVFDLAVVTFGGQAVAVVRAHAGDIFGTILGAAGAGPFHHLLPGSIFHRSGLAVATSPEAIFIAQGDPRCTVLRWTLDSIEVLGQVPNGSGAPFYDREQFPVAFCLGQGLVFTGCEEEGEDGLYRLALDCVVRPGLPSSI